MKMIRLTMSKVEIRKMTNISRQHLLWYKMLVEFYGLSLFMDEPLTVITNDH